MKLSQKGLDLICSFEGYLKKQKDGSCKAYQCPAGVWTIGWGCTEGVTPNSHWTREEAQERYHGELAKFEKAVDRLVKVPLNQNQFDALVSFSYNLGEGALASSTLLKKVNKRDFAGACPEFGKYIKARDGANGPRVVWPGLVNRRAKEASLFARPVKGDDVAEEAPVAPMPQAVASPSAEWVGPAMKLGGAGLVGGSATAATTTQAPPPPVEAAVAPGAIPTPPDMSLFTGWKGFADTSHDLYTAISTMPLFLVFGVALTVVGVWKGRAVVSYFKGTPT